ncbi:PolIII beta-like processivity factor [Bacillus phage vB_BcM_Sam46]|uniref:PolIII beta-like processivity factor n=2 Tax=Caudoviricetes TaxID=2731619 RepID=A0A6G9L9F1_9CAUD|nr:DNA polymerase III beta-like processivity factor [Bacillus phage vB_BcM_Sam112]QIQ61254.1 PolIII beta-like processivity factor [Bacillus phage vB_BcM_Sam46]
MSDKKVIEYIHGDLYGVALEVTKKWVAKSEMRPVLTYTRHQINGTMTATDSHRMIEIRNMHGFEDEYLINPKTFVAATGQYPDTTQLASKDGTHAAIALTKDQIKLWLQMFKSIGQTMKALKMSIKNKIVTMSFDDSASHVTIELKEQDLKLSLPGIIDKPSFDKIAFNVEYMRDAMEAHVKLQSEQVIFYMQSPMRPIIMDNDKNVTALILPVRVY